MSRLAERPPLPIWLASQPWPVLLGVLAGFAACCAAGRFAAKRQPYEDFVRFHTGISPEVQYFPTFSQAVNIARELHRSGTTLVIVGGNSILHGVGQRPEHLWTKKLQEELGPEYSVVNLAMRGGRPFEFAGLVAERLVADGVPLLYVTFLNPGLEPPTWDGRMYRYFFWDAWGKGSVPPLTARDEWVDSLLWTLAADDNPSGELFCRGLVDSTSYASDLWGFISLQYFGTTWAPVKGAPLWTPYRVLKDREAGDVIPMEHRFNPERAAVEVPNLRKQAESTLARDVLESTDRGALDGRIAGTLRAAEPDGLAGRTLYLMRLEAKYYLDLLTPEEQRRYVAYYRGFVGSLQRSGIDAMLLGEDWNADDYCDRTHISERGAARMAPEVALAIRAMRDRMMMAGPQRQETGQ